MKVRGLPIKWKLFLYLTLFAALVLAVLWLFQTVFLDDFYKYIKTEQIKSAAAAIRRSADGDGLLEAVEKQAQDKQLCALVIRNGEVAATADTLRFCVIHRLSPAALNLLQQWAYENGGTYLERFENAPRQFIAGPGFFSERLPNPAEDTENVVYVTLGQQADGAWVSIILNAAISPVTATVDTLRIQLTALSAVTVLLALLTALLMSRQIARPVAQTNDGARELAEGRYDVRFEAKGYREIEELSRTLNRAAYELSRVETLRRELIANVSHDLRTPLTMISGYAEAMRDLPGENNPDNAQVILDESTRLTRLVSDLLNLSRLQSGAENAALSPVNLTDELRAVAERFEKLPEPVRVTLDAAQDVTVLADPTQLGQALYNLTANAASYTEPGGAVELAQTVRDGTVTVSVTDHGPGIAQEDLPHIWERYYKVDEPHRRARHGSGLGLSIVRGVLERHGADYGVETVPGEGCRFWFTLPIQHND